MESEFSTYLKNKIIDLTLRGVTYSPPVATYLALYTTDPTAENVGTEVTGTAYARQQLTFDAPDAGMTENTLDITFSQATSDWGTVGWVGIHDLDVGGNLLYYTPLDVSKTITTGDTFRISTNNLTVTL
jgi:hypothetical protein